jgi:hypothetical protein
MPSGNALTATMMPIQSVPHSAWLTPALAGSDDSGEVRKSTPRSINTGSPRSRMSMMRNSRARRVTSRLNASRPMKTRLGQCGPARRRLRPTVPAATLGACVVMARS